MKTTMYPGNPYIENHNEIMGYDMPIGDALDMYDNEHGLNITTFCGRSIATGGRR